MQTSDTANAIGSRVWRDLAGLAVEALAIGVLFSLLLALAVLVMARARPDERFAEATAPADPVAAPVVVAAARPPKRP
ncbi:MAG: hypothetical protein ACREYB_08590 [Casimicrobiaceae bacterium]